MRDFFPLALVVFKLSFDQFGIIAWEHAKSQFGRAKMALYDLIHIKMIFDTLFLFFYKYNLFDKIMASIEKGGISLIKTEINNNL